MANTTISPNMSLIIPTVSVDPGPDWANNINASLSIIDQHNHSFGSGVQINQSGILLNPNPTSFDSLGFNTSNAFSLRSVRFTPQASPLSVATDIGCMYESGVDLYYNDGAGNQIRITSGGSLAGVAGTITGLPSGTASASYSGGTFVFQSATSTAANIDAGSYIFRNSSASSKGLTLNPPAAMAANFALTLPTVPGTNSFMAMDSSGNMGTTLPVSGALTTSNLSASAGILGTQLSASANILGSQLSSSAGITGGQIASNVALAGTGVTIDGRNTAVSGAGVNLVLLSITVDATGVIVAGNGASISSYSSTGYFVNFSTFTQTVVAVATSWSKTVAVAISAAVTNQITISTASAVQVSIIIMGVVA